MAEEDKTESCCALTNDKTGCCKVESLVSVDERGQMVLPKELREKANIGAGDKLAVISWRKGGKVSQLHFRGVFWIKGKTHSLGLTSWGGDIISSVGRSEIGLRKSEEKG